jgi:CRISPR/Cas system CMR-associated protein Cmr5 small subunit
MTSDAQRWRQTKATNDELYKTGRLTMDIVLGGHYESPEALNRAMNLAKQSDSLFADSTTQLHMSMIESTINNSPEILGNIKAFGALNEVNHTLAVNKFKQNYRTYLQQFSAVPGATFDKAREQALAKVNVDIQNALENGLTATGAFKEFLIQSPNEQQKQQLSAAQKTGIAQMNKIRDILRDTTKPAAQRYQLVAQQMNHAEIEKALTTYTEKQWNMPPVIAYVAETTNRTPLQVLNDIAPYIGDGSLTLQVDALNKEQRRRYSEFEVTPYSQIRNTFRTPQRTGRANVGDTKTGASAPVRSSMYKVVQYVSGDPAIRGKTDGRIVYDNGDGPRGHGGKNYHNHYEFATQEQAAAAKLLFEQNGYRVTSYLRPNDTGSAHSRGVAIDVAPPPDLPYTDEAEAEWSARANALIGFDPLENE